MEKYLIEKLMHEAYKEALNAYKNDEIPVGSLIYHNDRIIAKAHNKTRENKSPIMHSEFIVIKEALKIYPESLLRQSVLITTLEPCIMCSGMIILAKLKEVHFGVLAPKTGAVASLYRVFNDARLNHSPKFSFGYLDDQIASLLEGFFKTKRHLNHSGKKYYNQPFHTFESI